MRRFLLKLNGQLHCPGGISRPEKPGDWEMGYIELPIEGPELAQRGPRIQAPNVGLGDELWIWCHESKEWGDGLGLTARAVVSEVTEINGKPVVGLERVSILPLKIGKQAYLASGVSSRVIDYLIIRAHHKAYLLEDSDHDELLAVVAERRRPLNEHRVREENSFWRSALEERAKGLEPVAQRSRSEVNVRPEQARFRRGVFERYGKCQCLITGCRIEAAVEAAHVVGHNGCATWDRPENGLPMRRDLHGMFDAGLWGISPETNAVVFGDHLRMSLDRDDLMFAIEGLKIEHKVPKPLLDWRFANFLNGQNISKRNYVR